jgi:hypothetical protein
VSDDCDDGTASQADSSCIAADTMRSTSWSCPLLQLLDAAEVRDECIGPGTSGLGHLSG